MSPPEDSKVYTIPSEQHNLVQENERLKRDSTWAFNLICYLIEELGGKVEITREVEETVLSEFEQQYLLSRFENPMYKTTTLKVKRAS